VSFELRPTNSVVFAERMRNSEARKQQEMEQVSRHPRGENRRKAQAMRRIEDILDQRKLAEQFKEIWEEE
jgi:hypothetical protein